MTIVALFVLATSWMWFGRMGDWARPLVWLSFVWTGVLLLLAVALGDVGRGLFALTERLQGGPGGIERIGVRQSDISGSSRPRLGFALC